MSEPQQKPDKTPGIVSWNELITQDANGSTAFYTALFGWKVETMDMGGGSTYSMFNIGGRPAGGMLPMPTDAQGFPTMWMSYVTVENLKESVAKAQSLGARVVKEITQLPLGSFAVITDPQGAVLGLWEFGDEC